MRRLVSTVFAFAVLASPVAAQASHPDFSGKWSLDTKTVEGGTGMVPTSMTMNVTQDAKTMKVETAAATPMGDQTVSQTFNLDGSPAKSSVSAPNGSLDLVSTSAWDGAALVVTTKADLGGGQALEQVDHWSLDKDGKTMRLERNVSVAGQSMNMKMAFVKQ